MKIKLRGLDQGEFNYEFTESPELYKLNPEIFKNDLESNVFVEVDGKNYYIKVCTQTETSYECARCLKKLTLDFESNVEVIYVEKKSHDPDNTEEGVHYLLPGEHKADLEPAICENILLEMPMKVTCKEDCKGLCFDCGINLNISSCECEDQTTDPRWDALKKLK